MAFLRRDVLIARTYRISLGMELFSGILNLFIFFFISRTFDNPGEAQIGAAPTYFAFAFVGVTLTMVVQSTAVSAARRLREEQLTGTLEAVTAQPVTDAEVAFGLTGYRFAFALLRIVIYLVFGDLVLGLSFANADWVGTVAVVAATTLLLLGISLMIASAVLLLRRAEALANLATFLLALGGGAYFPVDALPGWLQPLATIMPTRLAFDGTRDALYRGSGWADDAGLLLLMAAVAIPLGIWLFGRCLDVLRRRGSLVEY